MQPHDPDTSSDRQEPAGNQPQADVARLLTSLLDGRHNVTARGLGYEVTIVLHESVVKLFVCPENSDSTYLLEFGLDGSGPNSIEYSDSKSDLVKIDTVSLPFEWKELLISLQVSSEVDFLALGALPEVSAHIDRVRQLGLGRATPSQMAELSEAIMRQNRGLGEIARIQSSPELRERSLEGRAREFGGFMNDFLRNETEANVFNRQLGKSLIDSSYSISWYAACVTAGISNLAFTGNLIPDDLRQGLSGLEICKLMRVNFHDEAYLVVGLSLDRPGELYEGEIIEPEKILFVALAKESLFELGQFP